MCIVENTADVRETAWKEREGDIDSIGAGARVGYVGGARACVYRDRRTIGSSTSSGDESWEPGSINTD